MIGAFNQANLRFGNHENDGQPVEYMSDAICPFCNVRALTLIAENELAFALRDTAPVRPLHTLIIPRRHIADIFAATHAELEALHELTLNVRRTILMEDPSVQGFNFGSNVGAAAGQVIFHAHVHLIPRRLNEAALEVRS